MPERVFVDTSGWVALFVKNDKFHARAKEVFKSIQSAEGALYTSDYVIDETVTTIRVNSNHHQSLIALESILDSRMTSIIHINPDYFLKTTQLYRKYKDQPYSFTDISSFVICHDLRVKNVFSFDGHFRIAGFNLL